MKHRAAILAAALSAAAVGGAARARAQVVEADVNAFVAEKFLDSDDWGPTDRQGELGVLTNWQWRSWPVEIAADFLAASRDTPGVNGAYNEMDAHTFELDLGARKIWRKKAALRPFAGAGPSLAYGYLSDIGQNSTTTSRAFGEGFWLDAGVCWAATDVFNLGFDARYSYADVRLFGLERNAGGFHIGMILGYHFGT